MIWNHDLKLNPMFWKITFNLLENLLVYIPSIKMYVPKSISVCIIQIQFYISISGQNQSDIVSITTLSEGT